jgi:hypothetical protein
LNTEIIDDEEEEPGKLSKKQQAILWRRSKVMEMYMAGFIMTAIADTLKVSISLISKDISSINQQATEQLKTITKNEIPLQWAKTRAALQFIQRESLQIWKDSRTETSKLAALQVFGNAQEKEFELIANSATLSDVMNFIESNKKENVIPEHNSKSKEESN